MASAHSFAVPEYENAECVAAPAGAGLLGMVRERSSLDFTKPSPTRSGAIRATGSTNRTISDRAAAQRERSGDFRQPRELDRPPCRST